MEIEIRETFPVIQIMTDISEVKEEIHLEDYKDEQAETNRNAFHHSNNTNRKKSFLHPIYGNNPYAPRANYSTYHCSNPNSNVSKFTQRVMSAKLLRSKQLQNQLAEAQTQINELTNENRMLKALYRRQDIALKKYEGSQEQLPQLMKSHSEEIRILSYKYKQLRVNYRDLENKLKQRDSEILVLKERNLHLTKLSKDKHLWDREKLTRKLEAMEITVKEQQHKIQMLNRKLELESKGYKHNLNLELNKLKEVKEELKAAQATIDSLRRSFEGKQNYVFIPQKLKPTQNSQLSYSRSFMKKHEGKSGLAGKLIKGNTDTGTNSSMSLLPGSGGQKSKQVEAYDRQEQEESIEEKEAHDNQPGLSHLKNKNLLKFHGQDSIEMSLNSGNNYEINKNQIMLGQGSEVKGVVSMNRTFHFQKKKNSELMNWISQEKEKSNHSTPANVSFYKKKWRVTCSHNEDHSSDGLSDDDIDEEDLNNSGKSLEHDDFSDHEWLNEKSGREPFITNKFKNEDKNDKRLEGEREKEDLGKLMEIKDSIPIDEKSSEKCINGKLHLKEVDDNIERLVEEACRGMELEDSDAELKEFEKFEAMTWEEFKEEGNQLALVKDKYLKDLSENNEEKLEEERKANLLKALEDIDKEKTFGVRKDFIHQDGSIEGVQSKVITADVLFSSILEKIKLEDEGYPTPSQVEKKRKTNLIQELFGESNCVTSSK